jgi:hypothetical protein
MLAVRASTRILSAFLEPDGSITVFLLFPDGSEPHSATIEPVGTTVQAAGPVSRPIDLAYGSDVDRHLRLIVAMHVDALDYERELARTERGLCRG